MMRVTAIVTAEALQKFTERLHHESLLHLISVDEQLPESFSALEGESTLAAEKAGKLQQVLSFCESWGALKKSFLESVFPGKTCAREEQIRQAADKIDAESLHVQANELRAKRDALLQRISSMDKETERLLVYKPIAVPLSQFSRLKHLRIVLARIPRPGLELSSRTARKP